MIQRFFYTGIILFGGLFYAAPVSALGGTVSVTATVLETRVIYIDANNDIQKVIGNTSSNIAPTVVQDGRTVPMSAKVSAEYTQLLNENGEQLKVGQTYFAVSYRPYQQLATWLISNSVFNSKLY